MTIPNAITRVIDKEGKLVPFDLSRIHRAVHNAISDIENAPSWEAKARALKYAESVGLTNVKRQKRFIYYH